ncbi:LamG-like jellyroll fold domain-containing protein [Verrucomicrobiaceae bacterium 227]
MNFKQHPVGYALVSTLALATLIGTSQAGLIGHWAFDEGTGFTTADSSGNGNAGTITDATWGTDEVRENYLIFNGETSIVDPALTLPVMTDLNDFTWTVWVNSQLAIGPTQQNAVIFGNRYDAAGLEFTPRQFTKLTPTKFEWHQNGNGNDNLDVPDLVAGDWHHIAIVKDGLDLEYFFDGISTGTRTLTELIGSVAHPFFIGGQANTGSVNEFFNGYIDDVRIYDEALTLGDIREIVDDTNLAPSFPENVFARANATVGTAYTASISGSAVDPNVANTLTYTIVDGPAWLALSPEGALTGTPALPDTGFNRFTIQASDNTATANATLVIQVINPDASPVPDSLFGNWPLNDGSGDIATDTSGNHFHAFITNSATGGLGIDGTVWAEDPEFGTVLSFDGENGTGAFATVGLPPIYGQIPVMDLEQDFTWSLWAKSDQEFNNDVILGNRYSASGAEFAPREFIKFTSTRFEYDTAGTQGFDYDDLIIGTWTHLTVVKDGDQLTYYRDGQFVATNTLTTYFANPQPLYFGGFGTENWRGYLSQVRLYNRSLSAAETLDLFESTSPGANETIVFKDITFDEARNLTLTWTSRNNRTYALYVSTGLTAEGQPGGWQEISDSIATGGDTTSTTLSANQFPNTGTAEKLFFQVRKVTLGE